MNSASPSDTAGGRSAGTEIERKFLVPPDFQLPPGRSSLLRQGYIVATDAGEEVRLRSADDRRFWLTYKCGVGAVRVEREIELTAEQFTELWPTTETRRAEKRRQVIDLGQEHAELDVYLGALAGLRTVEVEFDSVEAARAFAPPDWFGAEITDDLRYKVRILVTRGLPPE